MANITAGSDNKNREQISATRVIRAMDRWRAVSWPLWLSERRIVAYYNAKNLPLDDDEADDGAPVSVGLGYRYLSKPLSTLMDSVLMRPGFIQSQLRFPKDPSQKQKIESAVDVELNAIIHKRSESLLRSVGGRALITGRAFLYRKSRWDWKFEQGRMLHDEQDGDDVYDPSFREWGFMGRMTLRELDEKINTTRESKTGWNKSAMVTLKRWILKTTAVERNPTDNAMDWDALVAAPFDTTMDHRPLDVYWYFRKTGYRDPVLGRETIDLYCVSRHLTTSSVQIIGNDPQGPIDQYLAVNTPDENQTLYYVKDAFGCIDECLIPLLLDARIDGEQKMAQIDGTGLIMMNRLMPMEQLAVSMIEGMCWASQPNWTSQTAMDEQLLKKMARNGVGPWDFLPSGITTINKNNSISGMQGSMEMLRMLGVSADQDAATGEISPMQHGQPELKSLADKFVQQVDAATSRRTAKFFMCIDQLADEQLRTMCRPMAMWQKADAGYWDMREFQGKLFVQYKITPNLYSADMMVGKCRRLAMEGDRQQVAAKSAAFAQQWGGQLAPTGMHFLAKEAARATYDDATADMLLPDQPPVDLNQQMIAAGQEMMCLVSLALPQRNPSDNPIVHALSHLKALAAQLQAGQQQGSWSPRERQGAQLLAQHAAMDIPGLPPQEAKQAGDGLKQMSQAIATLPVAGQTSELQLKEADQQRKQQLAELQMEREHNLQGDRQQKLTIQQQRLMLDMHKTADDQKTSAVNRAATLTQAASNAPELPDIAHAAPASLPVHQRTNPNAPGQPQLPPPSAPLGPAQEQQVPT